MQLTQSDRGRTVEVAAGQTVTVRLPENPSTGHRWTVESAGGLQQIADRSEAAGAMGGAGMREIEFRAGPPGSHELRMRNRRSWEGDAGSGDRFDVTIVVK